MPPSCPCPLPTSSAQDNSDAQLGLLFVNTQQWGPHGPATVGAFQFMGFSLPDGLRIREPGCHETLLWGPVIDY